MIKFSVERQTPHSLMTKFQEFLKKVKEVNVHQLSINSDIADVSISTQNPRSKVTTKSLADHQQFKKLVNDFKKVDFNFQFTLNLDTRRILPRIDIHSNWDKGTLPLIQIHPHTDVNIIKEVHQCLSEVFNLLTPKEALVSKMTTLDKGALEVYETSVGHLRETTKKLSESLAFNQTQLFETLSRLTKEYEESLIKKKSEHETQLEELKQNLEKENVEKRNQLEQEYNKKLEKLEAARSELELEKQRIKDNERTHERRDLLEKIETKIKEHAADPGISEETQSKRRTLHFVYVIAILAFGTLAGFAGSTVFRQQNQEVDWRLFIPLSAGTIGFAAFTTFYLRWLNSWFDQHAKREFNNKQFSKDILRASWVAEMFFEWKEEKKTEFPSELMTSLTRDLFKEPGSINQKSVGSTPPVLPPQISKFEASPGGGVKLEMTKPTPPKT